MEKRKIWHCIKNARMKAKKCAENLLVCVLCAPKIIFFLVFVGWLSSSRSCGFYLAFSLLQNNCGSFAFCLLFESQFNSNRLQMLLVKCSGSWNKGSESLICLVDVQKSNLHAAEKTQQRLVLHIGGVYE